MNIKRLCHELGVKQHNPKLRKRQKPERGHQVKDYEFDYILTNPKARRHPVLPLIVLSKKDETYIIDLVSKKKLREFKADRNKVVYRGYTYNIYRLIAEAYNNRVIECDESVHHVNLNKNFNYHKNLRIMKHTEHVALHEEINALFEHIN